MYTHQCEEFRERITEHIIDREDLSAKAEFQRDLLLCSSCSDFYAESRETIDAISPVDFAISEDHWDAMTDRLRTRIEAEKWDLSPITPLLERSHRVATPFFAAMAVLLLITMGLYRVTIPEPAAPPSAATEYVYLDHSLALDPVTVDFLEESELLLRSVMKIEPNDVHDLADARKVAASQLVAINQRKEAAAVVPPVLNIMETYETLLRDLRNLNEDSPADDISDIQNRIQNNALIANMKAFQPTVSVVSVGLR